MKDTLGRTIDYLRISVTDRCNLRCTYCMPAEGITPKTHDEILSLEEIERLVRILAGEGIRKIRLTGGEPLVRKNIEALVHGLHEISGIEEISLTTNGVALAAMARPLKAAGLDRVNVSLDTLDADKFRRITRIGDLSRVLAGIEAAAAAGLSPLKVNVVAIRGFNDDEILSFVDYAVRNALQVRFIELMPLGEAAEHDASYLPMEEILSVVRTRYGLTERPPKERSGPSRDFQIDESEATVGVIAALSNHFCASCNRMRLTADGKFRPCLFSSREYDVRALLRTGADDARIAAFYRDVVANKPREHRMGEQAYDCSDRRMSQIGG